MDAGYAAVTPFRFVQLLAEERRWLLVRELGRSDRKVSELTERLGAPQNLVSYHLAALRGAGLVVARQSSADRRDTYYRLDLRRCADLLSGVAPALQPGLRMGLSAFGSADGRARGRRPAVLFLCTGNSARSQMAEALLEHHAGAAIAARSAGSHPKPLHPLAVRALAERGIDISNRASKHLDRFRQKRFDRVITLCDKVRETCPEFPGATDMAHWSMPDPAAVPNTVADRAEAAAYAAFVRTADELESRIPFLIGALMLPEERRATHGRQ